VRERARRSSHRYVRPRLLSHPLASLAEVEATEVRVAKAARVTLRITSGPKSHKMVRP
jgi:hypothetical protein